MEPNQFAVLRHLVYWFLSQLLNNMHVFGFRFQLDISRGGPSLVPRPPRPAFVACMQAGRGGLGTRNRPLPHGEWASRTTSRRVGSGKNAWIMYYSRLANYVLS